MVFRALHFRSKDRELNLCHYPRLCYPQMYLLQGGYRAFFEKFQARCEPSGYIEMTHSLYKEEYKKEISKRPFRKCFSEGFLR